MGLGDQLTAVQDIIRNTDNLPKDFKNKLLRKLGENEDAVSDVLAEVITGNYDRLPAAVRNELLLKLAENEDAAKGIAEVITGNYDRLPAAVRNELLLKLAENEDAIGALAWAAANDFDKLPDKIRNLSFKLADDSDLSWTLAKGIIDNYEKVPENLRKTLLFKLANHDYAAASLAREMTANYDRLPAAVRNELLLKLADNKYIVTEVTDLARQNLHKLDTNTIRELYRKVGIFSVPTFSVPTISQVLEWYTWFFSLEHRANPFHPAVGGKYWKENNDNKEVIWLAGVTATTEPAYKPSQISNINAVVAGSGARAVYNDGDGNPIQKLTSVAPRNIAIDRDDSRDLYIPIFTVLATATKYPKLAENLSELAQLIIDREETKGAPPAFVEFMDAEGNRHILTGNELRHGFRINGMIDQVNVPPHNVGMLPTGDGPAAFSDYAVILNNKALKWGANTLKFGVNGKFFDYNVEYKIQKLQ